MGKDNVEEFDFEQARRDESNLTKAGGGWKEDTKDPAVEFLKEIRKETEED